MNVAIYARKSRISHKGESINNQIALCKKFFLNTYSKNVIFFIYKDEGCSGSNINRPEFSKLISDAKKKKFDYLICYRLDRISRNVADFSSTLRIFEEERINFISITEQFDTSTVMGRAMINISATFAQMERETIAERVRDNMLELSKTGRWLGGATPLGFKSSIVQDNSSKKTYKLEVIEDEIEIVKLIFDMYLRKHSCSSIARYLCSNSIKGKNGGDFSRNTVLQIITNPVYCESDAKAIEYFKRKKSIVNCISDKRFGLMVYNKKKGGKKENPIVDWIIATGKHAGIISSNDWLKCQNILNETRKKKSPRQLTGKKFLLSGILKCGICGSSMCSWSRNYKNKYERYYRCELKSRASNKCSCKMLNADETESFVIDIIKSLDIKADINIIASNLKTSNHKKELTILNKKLNENNKFLTGIIKKLALIDDLDLLSMIQNEIREIKDENLNIKNRTNEINSILINTQDIIEKQKALLSNQLLFKNTIDFITDIEAKRKFIVSFIKCFVYYSETNTIKFELRI